MSDSSRSSVKKLRDAEVLIQNKNVTFTWLLLITQIFYSLIYAFFIRINSTSITTSEEFVHTAFLLLLVVPGFGLTFAFPARMVWTSLGFNLLITALSIQTFFLINAFWIKAKVFLGTSDFSVDTYTIYLSPSQSGANSTSANLNQAIKASLSCIVAFSFIKGRAGLLQAYFITIFGTIIYELTRQICLNNFIYEVGSIKIFVFGGILGYFSSLVLSRLGEEANYENHYCIYDNKKSTILNLLGLIICWALFPLLSRDAAISEVQQTQQTRVFSIVLAMSSAALLSIFLSGFQYGFRLVINSTVGAGIAILSSSAYISNPVYGIVFGLSSAIAQLVFQSIYTKFQMKTDINHFVFIGQGILGIFFATINRSTVSNYSNQLKFTFINNKRPEHILGNGAITVGTALLVGFILGALFSCCSYHEQIDHFNDFTYWREGDGLKYEEQTSVKKIEEDEKLDQKQDYIVA